MSNASQNDKRYPYTYAADYLRMSLGREQDFSRADASRVRSLIAEAAGVDDHQLACQLADRYIEYEDTLTEDAVESATNGFGA